MSTEKSSAATLFMILVGALEGLIIGLYGTCVSEFMTCFMVDEVKIGTLASLLYLASIPGILLALRIASRFGMGRTLRVALTVQALSLLLFSAATSFLAASISYVLVGLTYGVLLNGPIGYINHTYGDRGAKYLNWFYGAFAFGLVVGPMLSGTLLVKGYGWQVPYRIVAGLIVVASVLLIGRHFAQVPLAQVSLSKKSLTPRYWALVAGFSTYSITEGALNIWIGRYMSFVFNSNQGHYALTVFWIGMIIGRVLSGIFAGRVSISARILVLGTVAISLLFSVGLCPSFASSTFVIGLAALCLSGIGPGIINLLGVSGSGQATALAISVGTVTVAICMPLVALAAGTLGFDKVLGISATPLIVAMGVMLVLSLRDVKSTRGHHLIP